MLKSILLVAVLGLAFPASAAQDIIIDSRKLFDDWSYPAGTLNVGEDGLVRADSIRKNINAALNAPNFSYLHKFEGTGGIRSVGTAPATADLAIDGDTTTVWTPSMADDVANWWIEFGPRARGIGQKVALGVRSSWASLQQLQAVRLRRRAPFRRHENPRLQTGIPRPWPATKITLWRSRSTPSMRAGTRCWADHSRWPSYSWREKSRTPAWPNWRYWPSATTSPSGPSTGAEASWVEQVLAPLVAIDGVVTSEWHTSRSGNVWLVQPGNAGNWFRLDLGATFWIEDLFLDTRSGMPGYRIFFSDGSESIVTREEVWQVDGRNLEWELGVDHDNKDIAWARLNDFHFDPPRKARYLFWHQFHGIGAHVSGAFISEVMVFGQGFLPRGDADFGGNRDRRRLRDRVGVGG